MRSKEEMYMQEEVGKVQSVVLHIVLQYESLQHQRHRPCYKFHVRHSWVVVAWDGLLQHWVVLAHSNRVVTTQEISGNRAGIYLISLFYPSVKRSLCPAVVLFRIQNSSSDTGVANLLLPGCRVFHGKRSRCTWHVALEGSHYKPVKSPFVLVQR